jgi:DNA polymerase-3 subunit alpha
LESVFQVRESGGAFGDVFDFAARVDAKRLNKGVLEALVQCGAFDAVLAPIGISRARAFAATDRALERSRSASRDRERGQTTLFGMFDAASAHQEGPAAKTDEYPAAQEWDRLELLRREKAALGCYVSGHPLLRYGGKLARLGATQAVKVSGEPAWSAISVAGMVEGYQEKIFKGSGSKAAFFEIEDMSGRVKAKLRGDRIDTYAPILTGGEAVLISGKVSFPITDDGNDEEKEPTLLVDSAEPLADAVLKATRALSIRLEAERTGRQELEQLRTLLLASPGPCPVELVLALPGGAEAVMALDGTRVTPTDQVLSGLERMFGGTVAELR